MIKLLRGIFILLILSVYNDAEANNIRVKKFHLTDTVRSAKTVNLTFDLSWENSWRDDVNWDAAWIILKVKRANGSWKHIKLQPTGNSIIGNPAGAKIVVPDDKMGAFIYRSAKGDGNIDMTGVKFAWNYGADSVANIDSTEVRIFATEMVYVPEGSFAFGDSYLGLNQGPLMMSSDRIVQSVFKNATVADTAKFGKGTPMFAIISEHISPKLSASSSTSNSGDQTIVDGFYISGTAGIGISTLGSFKYPRFPTGYRAFYCMKYETTQGQYTDFLNSTLVVSRGMMDLPAELLPKPQTSNIPLGRFSIEKLGEIYVVSRPDRAMDHTSPEQVFSFSNWSSLRPMTELEFEKAARGPLAPKAGERANGVSPNIQGGSGHLVISTLKLDGAETGIERSLDSDSTKFLDMYNGNIIGGDGGAGPYRVGIFATEKSNRASSGGSYYGISGLTDNAQEFVVPLSVEATRVYTDANGIGENRPNGYPVYTHWNISNPNFQFFSVKANTVSERGITYNQRAGFRLVRNAPADN